MGDTVPVTSYSTSTETEVRYSAALDPDPHSMMFRRIPLFSIVCIVALVGVAASGCSFDSTTGLDECANGTTSSDGYVCVDGEWVQPDSGAPTDTTASDTDVGGETPDGGDRDTSETPDATDSGPTDAVDAVDVDTSTPPDTRADGGDADARDVPDSADTSDSPDTRDAFDTARDTADGLDATQDTDDGFDGSLDADATDTNDADDGGDACPGSPGCPCDYNGHSTGVCANATIGPNGECQQPADFEYNEQTCNDSVDNDCDGDTDTADRDCSAKEPGKSCSADGDCRSENCVENPAPTGPSDICAHRIFVTSENWKGDLGGPGGADQKCKRLANSATLDGSWRAVVSTSLAGAAVRVAALAPVFNLNSPADRVFDGSVQMWSTDSSDAPYARIRYDESGTDTTEEVWTGTRADGTVSTSPATCDDWTDGSGSSSGRTGDSNSTDTEEWIDKNIRNCNKKFHLYCIDGQ